MLTETGPYIPVSLGVSYPGSENEQCEELVEEYGDLRGAERRSFILNIHDLRTESIDKGWNELVRSNGLSDGTNNNTVWVGRESREPTEVEWHGGEHAVINDLDEEEEWYYVAERYGDDLSIRRWVSSVGIVDVEKLEN